MCIYIYKLISYIYIYIQIIYDSRYVTYIFVYIYMHTLQWSLCGFRVSTLTAIYGSRVIFGCMPRPVFSSLLESLEQACRIKTFLGSRSRVEVAAGFGEPIISAISRLDFGRGRACLGFLKHTVQALI